MISSINCRRGFLSRGSNFFPLKTFETEASVPHQLAHKLLGFEWNFIFDNLDEQREFNAQNDTGLLEKHGFSFLLNSFFAFCFPFFPSLLVPFFFNVLLFFILIFILLILEPVSCTSALLSSAKALTFLGCHRWKHLWLSMLI